MLEIIVCCQRKSEAPIFNRCCVRSSPKEYWARLTLAELPGPGGVGCRDRLPLKQDLMVRPWLLPCWILLHLPQGLLYSLPPCKESALEELMVPFIRWTVCISCLSQQHCSKSSSIAIISATIPGAFLFCSSTWLNFSLSFLKDFSATLYLSNIDIKQHPIVAIFIGNCAVLIFFVF